MSIFNSDSSHLCPQQCPLINTYTSYLTVYLTLLYIQAQLIISLVNNFAHQLILLHTNMVHLWLTLWKIWRNNKMLKWQEKQLREVNHQLSRRMLQTKVVLHNLWKTHYHENGQRSTFHVKIKDCFQQEDPVPNTIGIDVPSHQLFKIFFGN